MKNQCTAVAYIADSYGDNEAEMRCQLPEGHEGMHEEIFHRENFGVHRRLEFRWEGDEKALRHRRDLENFIRLADWEIERVACGFSPEGHEWKDHFCTKCGLIARGLFADVDDFRVKPCIAGRG